MLVGDLVIVKDAMGYNAYMQNLVGHIGVVCELDYNDNVCWVRVHILGRTRPMNISDLEAVKKCP
tara:strand:+ start:348 stop:542 length:195 start_codon:yes stop_codon:yes gene_type:complete